MTTFFSVCFNITMVTVSLLPLSLPTLSMKSLLAAALSGGSVMEERVQASSFRESLAPEQHLQLGSTSDTSWHTRHPWVNRTGYSLRMRPRFHRVSSAWVHTGYISSQTVQTSSCSPLLYSNFSSSITSSFYKKALFTVGIILNHDQNC